MHDDSAAAFKSIHRHRLFGLAVVVFLTFGVGGWAVTTDLSGALIAPGTLVVGSHVKEVQHPTGGIVGELLVHDGDHVKDGDILVHLDPTATRANLAIYTKGLDELAARKARLQAERDSRPSITFPPDLLARANDPDVADIIGSEQKLFELRRTTRTRSKSTTTAAHRSTRRRDLRFAGTTKRKKRANHVNQARTCRGARPLC